MHHPSKSSTEAVHGPGLQDAYLVDADAEQLRHLVPGARRTRRLADPVPQAQHLGHVDPVQGRARCGGPGEVSRQLGLGDADSRGLTPPSMGSALPVVDLGE